MWDKQIHTQKFTDTDTHAYTHIYIHTVLHAQNCVRPEFCPFLRGGKL